MASKTVVFCDSCNGQRSVLSYLVKNTNEVVLEGDYCPDCMNTLLAKSRYTSSDPKAKPKPKVQEETRVDPRGGDYNYSSGQGGRGHGAATGRPLFVPGEVDPRLSPVVSSEW